MLVKQFNIIIIVIIIIIIITITISSSSSSSKEPVSYTMLGPTVVLLVSEVSKVVLAWENSKHFATPVLNSPRNDVWESSAEIPH